MEKIIVAGALIAGALLLMQKQDDTGGNSGYAIPEGIFGSTPTQAALGQSPPQTNITYNIPAPFFPAPFFPAAPENPFAGITSSGYTSPQETTTKKEAKLTGLPPADTWRSLGSGHPAPQAEYNPQIFNNPPPASSTSRATTSPTRTQPVLSLQETNKILAGFDAATKKETAIKDLYATYTPQPIKLPEYGISKKEAR